MVAWQLKPAGSGDIPAIEGLVASVGGDQEGLLADQFVVAQDSDGEILGCGRLKPYADFVELASLAIAEGFRGRGVGRGIVTKLLERRQGPIYLICEDNAVEFFRRFGFKMLPPGDMPKGLVPKWRRYAVQASHIHIMRRD